MNRRKVLQGAGGAGIAAMSGCLGTLNQITGDGWSPRVEGENPTIAPGEESTLTVEATDIGGFQFILPESEGINFKTSLDDTTVSPMPDSGNDSLPPQWFWPSRTDVTVTTPVVVAEDVIPGEYEYGARVWPIDHAEREKQYQSSITVTDA